MNIRIACLGSWLLAGCYAGSPAGEASAPRSLAGTHVDGELRTGANDEFVFDAQARLAFDYFLTADDELAPEELDGWVRAELGRRLPPRAAHEAFVAWEAYVGFRGEAAQTLAGAGEQLAAAEQTLLAAVDEQLGDYPIAADEKAEIARGFALKRISAMHGAARDQALAEMLARPEGEAAAFLAARREIAAAEGEAVAELRAQHFGAEAAARLAGLDTRRADWARRVEKYRGEREALRGELAGAELEEAIAALEGQFSAEELRRVRALERIATP